MDYRLQSYPSSNREAKSRSGGIAEVILTSARRANQVRQNGDHWGNSPTPLHTPQASQTAMAQWNGFNNTPSPMTIVVTNPEDQQWLSKVTSLGCDPATVITSARQQHLQQTRMQSPRTLNVASSHDSGSGGSTILPSGLVACNECANISSTIEQAEEHTSAAHNPRQLELTNGSGRQI